jgi:hypothetical protein
MSVLAWHFIGDTLRDGRPVPSDEEVLRHDGPLVVCQSGLHASVKALDALQFAPGFVVCRVECGGETLHESDKLVCRERTILWRLDATDVLLKLARLCALDVAHMWKMPTVVRQFLETGEESSRAAAGAAARAAAWDAARAAARPAARPAAWAAAEAASRAAAWDAAWDASRAAARATAGFAAEAAAEDAVWAAAWDAAWDASRAAQEQRLVAMLIEEARA